MAASSTALQKNAIGMWQIVFFVIAAAAPLTGMLGIIPVAIRLGNGAGVPGAFVAAGLILLVFSVGYAAMSRHVVNAGAFYAYLAQGLSPAALAWAARSSPWFRIPPCRWACMRCLDSLPRSSLIRCFRRAVVRV